MQSLRLSSVDLRPPISHTVGVFAMAAVFVALLGIEGVGKTGGDADKYLAMTAEPGTFSLAPWGFRIGTPFLAWLLPLEPAPALWVVNTVFLAAAVAGLFWLVAGITGLSQAAFVALLFLVSPAVVRTAENPLLVDPSYYLFLVVCLALTLRHRWWWLAAALAASVFFKESVLLLVPSLGLIALWSRSARSSWAQVGLVLAAPAVVYTLIHWTPLLWGSVPVGYKYGSWDNFEQVIAYIHRWGSIPKVFVSSFLHSWSALWVVFALALLKAPVPIRLAGTFALVCAATMLIATDWPRMLYPAFVVVLPTIALVAIAWPRRAVTVLLLAFHTLLISRMDPSGLKYVYELLVGMGILAAYASEMGRIVASLRRHS